MQAMPVVPSRSNQVQPRRAGPVIYCIAYVKLDEGVTMMTNIVDCDLDTVKIGQKVKVVFKQSEGGTAVPMFAPA